MFYLLILLPFCCLVLLNLPPKRIVEKPAFLRLGFSAAILLALLQLFLVIRQPVMFWSMEKDTLAHLFTFGLGADALTSVMFISIAIVFFVSVIVGWNTLSKIQEKFYFVNLLLISLIGMNATCLASDIFSLYIFIEITALSSYIMIAMQRNILSLEGAFKYMILSVIATVLMLTSIGLIMLLCGSTNFATVASVLKISSASYFVKLAVGLFVCGLFIKSGLVPFHGWLPDAYSAAPSAASVFLAGIVTKATGVYVLIRLVVSVFGFNLPLQNTIMFVGALSIVVGAFAALTQSDFKRMLAYSSISQVGYIILALGCGTKLALVGAVFHLFNHAIFKTLLFTNAASVEQRLGSVNMDDMNCLGAKMPVTSSTSVIAMLSTAGIPPLSGFWSKLIIIMALWNAQRYGFALVAVLASVVTLAYFLSMQRRVFFGNPGLKVQNIKEVGFGLTFVQVMLAVIIIAVGVFFPVILNSLILPVGNILK